MPRHAPIAPPLASAQQAAPGGFSSGGEIGPAAPAPMAAPSPQSGIGNLLAPPAAPSGPQQAPKKPNPALKPFGKKPNAKPA